MLHASKVRSAILVALGALSMSAHVAAEEAVKQVDVPAGQLTIALKKLAEQSGVEFFYSTDQLEGLNTQGVQGSYTPENAVQKLIEGTRLELTRHESGALVIAMPDRTAEAGALTRKRLAQIGTPSVSAASGVVEGTMRQPVAEGGEELVASREAGQLEEILVTGSHIRGGQNLSSPVLSFDRHHIESSGFATTQQFLQSLPQNLNSISDTTFSTVNGGQGSNYGGSGLNLRGLGGDATLVLLNGRRLAAAGNGSFVDVSLIPLGAIERIDVLMDGASAIYGSDAIGGVVNITLRENHAGAETRLRYGTVTEGSHDEVQAAQTIGHAWTSGEALISYEYYQRSELEGSDRDFFQPQPWAYEDLILIPEQQRHGVLAVLNQRLTDAIELSTDVFYGERQSVSAYQSAGMPLEQISDVKHYGASLGLSLDLAGDWQARLSSAINKTESDQHSLLMPQAAELFGTSNESRLLTADLAADGPVMNVPAGEIRLAIGAQFRDDRFVEGYSYYPARLERDIAAAYAEVLAPLVGDSNGRPGMTRLELTLAGRYEEYSDFGSTFNPKVGLAWSPWRGLNVRGSWGTSFKAPLLSQMNPQDLWASIEIGRYMDVTGAATVLNLSGGGEKLRPEKSTNRTIGFDLALQALPQLSLSTTYFHIDYQDRVRTPFPSGYDIHGAVLQDPMYANLVTRNPAPARVAELMSHPNTFCYTGNALCESMPDPEQVVALVDERLRNIAGVRMSGVDVSATYKTKTHAGDWSAQLSGTNFLKYRERLSPGATEANAMNDVWRPVDLRLRGGLSFTRGAFAAATFINYTDGYRDTRGTNWTGGTQRRSTVGSWTTVDLTLQYDLTDIRPESWPGEMTLTLNGLNVLDRDPPYVASFAGLFFDGVNASPLGRFISAQVTVRL